MLKNTLFQVLFFANSAYFTRADTWYCPKANGKSVDITRPGSCSFVHQGPTTGYFNLNCYDGKLLGMCEPDETSKNIKGYYSAGSCLFYNYTGMDLLLTVGSSSHIQPGWLNAGGQCTLVFGSFDPYGWETSNVGIFAMPCPKGGQC